MTLTRTHLRAVAAWLLLMLTAAVCASESMHFRHLTVEDGLSNRWVTSLVQDRDGLIWIGTDSGLNRYDGHSVRVFNTDPEAPGSLPSDYVVDLTLDRHGELWVATGDGVSRYDRSRQQFINYSLRRPDVAGDDDLGIRRIALDASDRIWLATWFGIARFDPQSGDLSFPVDAHHNIRGEVALTLHRDSHELLWTAFGDTGLLRIDPDAEQFEVMPLSQWLDGESEPEIQSIHSDHQRLFLAGPFGVLVVDRQQWELLQHFPTGEAENQLQGAFWVMDLLLDDQQRLWVGNEEQLQRIDLDSGRIVRQTHQPARRSSLSSNRIAVFMQDRDGLVWIGTETDGLNIFNPVSEAFRTLGQRSLPDSTDGLAGNDVWSVLEDDQDRLWVTTEHTLNLVHADATVQHFQPQDHRNPRDHEIGSPFLGTLAMDSDGHILVAGTAGVDRFDPQRLQVSGRYRNDPDNPESLVNDFIYSLFMDDRDRLWVGTRHGLSLRIGEQRFRHFLPGDDGGLPDGQINHINQLSDGTVIVGTYTGLYAFDEQQQRFFGVSLQALGGGRDLRAVSASALTDAQDQLLVGTTGLGLLLYDWPLSSHSTPVARFRSTEGLANDRVWAIEPDAAGFFWISTNHGLSRFNPADGSFVNYSTATGLPDNEFNEGASGIANNGDLMFGGVRGLVRFDPADVNRLTQEVSRQIVFTDISVDGQALAPQEQHPILLDHDTSRLRFRFAVTEYSSPGDHRYRYRLDPVQRDWVDLGQRGEIEFLRLQPGRYTLEVQGRNARGHWSDQPAVLSWRIQPPPWRSTWAYTAYALTALALLLLITWIIGNRRRQRRATLAAIRANRTRLHLALMASGDGLWDWHAKDNTVHRSQLAADSSLEELATVSLEQDRRSVHVLDLLDLESAWQKLLDGQNDEFELEYRRQDGSELRWIRECGKVVERDSLGRVRRVSGTFKDISEERKTADHARLFGQAFDHTSEAVVILDAQRRVVAVNRAFHRITGFARDAIIGQSSAFLSSSRHDREFYRAIWQTVHSEGHWSGELWERKSNDEPYPCWINISVVHDEQQRISHYVAVFSDITERKMAEEKLRRLAKFDPLTELPNRSFLKERLEKALSHAEREWQQLGVLFLDLDRFKQINDSLGHNVGDRLLQIVAQRLGRCVRKHDTVARISGDEFVILLENIPDAQSAAHVAEKVLDSLNVPMQLEGNEVTVSTSIGISVYPNDGADAAILLKNADTAMYHAKSEGRNNFQYYAPEMNASAFERLSLENALRKAVSGGELLLYFQPRFNTTTGQVVGAEALVRWQHPKRGMVSPGEFIPVAEETGLIKVLGDWVMQKAIACIADWQQRFSLDPVFRVSVNLSPRQLIHDDLREKILGMLRSHKVAGSRLELEITEGVLMDRKGRGVKQLQELESMGLCVSVDDFGTGYSSMNYLKDLPINVLKIDQSFVRDIERDPQDAAIVNTIIQLAHSLSLQVVAEGVETEGQLDYLKRHGCELVQGFLLGKPMPEEAFCSLLQEKQHQANQPLETQINP